MVGFPLVALSIVRRVSNSVEQLRRVESVLLKTYCSPRPDKNREHLRADSEMSLSKRPIKAAGVMIAESDSRLTIHQLLT